MASSNTKRKGTLSFKKRDSPVQEVVIDDDDDDFKPSKNPFPSRESSEIKKHNPPKRFPAKEPSKMRGGERTTGSSATKQLSCPIVTASESEEDADVSSVNAQLYSTSILQRVSDTVEEEFVGGVDAPEIEEILIDEQENCAVSCSQVEKSSVTSTSKEGKEAWKNLMGQMQKNQKEMKASGSKRGKPPTKRILTQSPKSKSTFPSTIDYIQSPVKKNARLGSGESATKSALNEFKKEITLDSDSESQKLVPLPMLEQLNEVSQTKKEATTATKPSRMIAPVFLPPAERKALQKTLSVKNDSEDCISSIINADCESQLLNNNLPEDPTQFNGNVVILNQHHTDKDPYEGLKTKVCPFYKKLPGVPFCVDAFNYGLIPGMEVYFLSHFHSDHYIGLSKKFCKTIICSHPTGNLVRMKLYVEEKCIRKLHLNKPYLISGSEVTLIDANHCPGSVMFVFRFKTGKVTLHTGDFRYTPNMLANPYLSGVPIDDLYLDTTYCSPQYDFPTQNESVSNVIAQVKRHLEYRPQTLILCGSYMIGKERVYFSLAEAIGSKVYGTFDKRKIINALENKTFSSLLSADEKTQIHVVPMFSISAKNLQEYLAKYPQYTNIIGIKPSGWQFSSCGTGCSVKTHYNGTVTVLGIPYSEHSSFSELREFVTNLKPKRVQPTVNVGNPKKRGEMMQHIESWLSA